MYSIEISGPGVAQSGELADVLSYCSDDSSALSVGGNFLSISTNSTKLFSTLQVICKKLNFSITVTGRNVYENLAAIFDRIPVTIYLDSIHSISLSTSVKNQVRQHIIGRIMSICDKDVQTISKGLIDYGHIANAIGTPVTTLHSHMKSLFDIITKNTIPVPIQVRRLCLSTILYYIDDEDVIPDHVLGRGYEDDIYACNLLLTYLRPRHESVFAAITEKTS